ncbi:hypothetical protein GCM10007103_14000 [Salinimicrobium marinum]|uniref:Uncharacterized protein n=1 Tax=Salinimicrobium marinum TaxID=680283 RepID=A0A918SDS6_9FLAO|nr:hypothetical protein [Salinimicrobium marinum]GHA33647.1 hypothetical protein GCM10007103_14000 [Salinimicrobium marinum]
MRLSKNVQVLVFSSIAAVTTGLALVGNRLQKDPGKLLKNTVEDATTKWKKRLFLTPEQTELMRKNLKDFALRKHKVLQIKINEHGKKERLKELQLLENEEIRKFLTDSQYDSYLQIISERVE